MATSVDWQHEWSASLGWSGMALVGVVAVSAVIIWLLARFTCWGQQLWRIATPYFRPHRSWVSWRPLLTLLVMLWLTVLDVRIQVLASYAMNGLFTAMQQLDSGTFAFFLMILGVLSTLIITSIMMLYFSGQVCIIHYFLNEGLGASFRYALVRLRDHSESVAFYHGEKVERATLATRFAAVITNSWALAFRRTKFQGFNSAITQIALLNPYIIQAPHFFRRAITLGDVQQTTTAFIQVHMALSFFRDSYDTFATYRATLNRLTGLLDANNHTRALPSVTVVDCPDGLTITGLTVRRLTADHVLFLSQQPYPPLGQCR